MQLEYTYSGLERIIKTIKQNCVQNNESFFSKYDNKINFKKSIAQVTSSNTFFELVVNYTEFLNKEYLTSDSFFNLIINEGLQCRVKLRKSILTKLNKYQNKEIDSGESYPMIKCLNDLIGMRVILCGVMANKEQIEDELTELRNRGVIYRYYFREDGDYKGYHCYFKMNNKSFPWELQIWDKKWESKNLIEHKRHENEKIMLK